MSSCSSTASLLPLVFSNNWQILDSIHSTVSLANQRAWVGVTTQYSCISVRARAMYTLVTVATTPFQVSNTMSSWYYSELDDAAQSRYRAKLVLLGGIQDLYLQQTPSGRELFRGDFRAVRQQTAVFFADTHTHTHIYIDGLKRLTLPCA